MNIDMDNIRNFYESYLVTESYARGSNEKSDYKSSTGLSKDRRVEILSLIHKGEKELIEGLPGDVKNLFQPTSQNENTDFLTGKSDMVYFINYDMGTSPNNELKPLMRQSLTTVYREMRSYLRKNKIRFSEYDVVDDGASGFHYVRILK